MLHTKIVDTKKEKILTSNAEKFIKDSKFKRHKFYINVIDEQDVINEQARKLPRN